MTTVGSGLLLDVVHLNIAIIALFVYGLVTSACMAQYVTAILRVQIQNTGLTYYYCLCMMLS